MGSAVKAMGSLDVGAANTALSKAKRATFPLPRELRDQIYSYLLHHDHVKAPPYHKQNINSKTGQERMRDKSTAHTYRFHTSVLGVNHQMRSEAEQILASNHFVIISFKWAGLQFAVHFHDVPLVCQNQAAIAKFQHHVMRVHLQHTDKKKLGSGIKSFAIVAADLLLFCGYIMSWTFVLTITPAPLLFDQDTGSGRRTIQMEPKLPAERDQSISSHTKIQLLSTKSLPMTEVLEANLLRPFQDMAMGCQKVTFLNTTLTQYTTSLQESMDPPCVSVMPSLWRAIDILREIKSRADSLASGDDFARALDKYSLLSQVYRSSNLFLLPMESFDDETTKPTSLLLRILLDSYITMSFLMLRLEQITQAVQAVSDTHDIVAQVAIMQTKDMTDPASVSYPPCVHGAAWLDFVTTMIVSRQLGDLPFILHTLRQIEAETDDTAAYRSLLRAHLVKIERIVSDPKGTPFGRPNVCAGEVLKLFELDKFPPPIFDSPTPSGWTKPAECEGLLLDRHKRYFQAESATKQL